MTNKSLSLPITIPKKELQNLCQLYKISKLSLFGSVLRNDFTEDSDIDFLVEFNSNYIPTFFKLSEIERELSKLFNNRKIDLRTKEELSPYFRDKVLQEAIVSYEATR